MSQQVEEQSSYGSLTEPLLNADEAAQLLHVPRSTLYELVLAAPAACADGRNLRFTRTELRYSTFGHWYCPRLTNVFKSPHRAATTRETT